MSTAQPQATPQAAVPPEIKEIRIVSHSNLFYWWPVWAVGILLFLLTVIEGNRMAVVPNGTEISRTWQVVTGQDEGGRLKTDIREGFVLPRGKHLKAEDPAEGDTGKPDQNLRRMTSTSSYGVLFATVLLLTIVITNVPLRGLWSFVIIIVAVLLIVIFALAGWWDTIFHFLGHLDIRINAGGYLFISLVLLGIWLVTMLFFDRQVYMVFTPGQLRVCLEVGGGETAYDTSGMVIQKLRNDLFRHWILGLGSGDLIVRTFGANAHEFHLPNVLFVGRKLQMIEQMQRDRPVVRGHA